MDNLPRAGSLSKVDVVGRADGRTEPNLDDLSLAFHDLGILLSELEEYIGNVEPVAFAQRVPNFPVARPTCLQHPKPGSRELLQRPEWVHEFLPPMHPELEEEESMLLSPGSTIDGMKRDMASNSAGEEMSSPHGSPQPVKRNADGTETPTPKRFRLCTEEEGQPMREVTSVFMTPSGFISPAREGKLPEPSAPSSFIKTLPPGMAFDSDSSDSIPIPHKEVKLKELKKTAKVKKEGKDGKKAKASKKDNKENANIKKAATLFGPFMSKKSSSCNPMLKIKKKLTKGLKLSKDGSSSKIAKIKSKSKSKNKGAKSPSTSGLMAVAGLTPKPVKVKSLNKSKSPSGSKMSKAEKKKLAAALAAEPAIPFVFTPLPAPTPPAEEERSKLNAAAAAAATGQAPVDEDPYADEPLSREESPEPRLVIDDSPETLSKQEKESRLADIELCIDAVIQKAREESRLEEKRETLEAAMSGMLNRKLEPRDVYDFTDSDSSPPPTPKTPDLVSSPAPKKEPSPERPPAPPVVTEHKKPKEKTKGKKKSGKAKSGSGTPSPKKGVPKTPEMKASPLVALSQRAEKSPEPPPSFSGVFPFSQQQPPQPQPSPGALFSPKFPAFGSPPTQGFLPAFPFSSQLRAGTSSHFPTPPLFVPPPSSSRDDLSPASSPPVPPGGTMGPIVLGGSPFAVKTLAEKKAIPPLVPSTSRADEDKPAFGKSERDSEKGKAKEKKEKKLEKKEHAKKKAKEKLKEKPPKEKKEGKAKLAKVPEKTKAEKKTKVKAGKEKGKKKGKEEKVTGRKGSKASKAAAAPAPQQPQLAEAASPLPTARMVITETVGTIVDERGNKIWICPACAKPDDGSPMIGCDECDDWYHWVCVGIVVPPKEEESWFCNRCIAKRQGALAKKKKKKHRKDK
ncbi:hypothetical protein HPB48_024410 [Haemaphysalis longicornis]|uniref:PHD-type domain-containing protein n=1 Tax=Haemaphysalis longicornis TaxID=44386 RepID=A0A9J6H887_HAELO|nr:hypothetical protein HPB48_024410 [Haemaphysalis longicornis]